MLFRKARRMISGTLALVIVTASFLSISASAISALPSEVMVPLSETSGIDRLSLKNVREIELLAKAYDICVNDISFECDTDFSGNGWNYKAEANELYLENYSGEEIISYGDLNIIANGINVITAEDSNSGIHADGALNIKVQSGSLSVYGSDSTKTSGDGVSANGVLNCYCAEGASAYFEAGDTTSTEEIAGDGLFSASMVYLSGSGITSVGGNAQGSMAGCGVLSPNVYINANCTLQGGNGIFGGCGVYFGNYCNFGAINATIKGGEGKFGYAIDSSDELNWTHSKHADVTGDVYTRYITVKKYCLTLQGNGGNRAEDITSVMLEEYYPAVHDLSKYIFNKAESVQASWTTEENEGNHYRLNEQYVPEANTSLYAYWLSVDTGDIVLNSMNGDLDTKGTFCQQYTETEVTLPADVIYKTENEQLLGWSTSANYTVQANGTFDGQWYCGGEKIEPSEETAIALYAHSYNMTGAYVIYHPTQGDVMQGGSILVQGTDTVTEGETVLALDESSLITPQGYELLGWSLYDNTNQTDYEIGAQVPLKAGNVLHLYAVWGEKRPGTVLEDGLTIRWMEDSQTAEIEATNAWCVSNNTKHIIVALYTTNGKMIVCDMKDAVSDASVFVELAYSGEEKPNGKLFVLGDVWIPLRDLIIFQ